jgi:hypothetical protein
MNIISNFKEYRFIINIVIFLYPERRKGNSILRVDIFGTVSGSREYFDLINFYYSILYFYNT